MIPAEGTLRRCEHGVYVPQYESVARYCSACNPQAADSVLRKAMAKAKPACRAYSETRTMDAADFMRQPAGARLAEMEAFL